MGADPQSLGKKKKAKKARKKEITLAVPHTRGEGKTRHPKGVSLTTAKGKKKCTREGKGDRGKGRDTGLVPLAERRGGRKGGRGAGSADP